VLLFFEKNCVALCKFSDQSRVRHVYEILRDHLGLPTRDGAKIAGQLRDASLRSLTAVLIALDLPRKDPRLTKFHVELLYRLLLNRNSGTPPVAGTAVQDALQDRRFLAVECLKMLENAYPTLLSTDASSFVALAVNEAVKNPTPGFIFTQLASSVVSHLAAIYLHQQEEYSTLSSEIEEDSGEEDRNNYLDVEASYSRADGNAIAASTSSTHKGKAAPSAGMCSDSDDDGTEEVLTAAADVLCMAGGTTRALYDVEDELEVDFSENNTAVASGTVDSSLDTTPRAPTTPSGELKMSSNSLAGTTSSFSPSSVADEQHHAAGGGGGGATMPLKNKALSGVIAMESTPDSSGTSSPRGILASAGPASSTASASASVPNSRQSSKRSMLASVAEADELDSVSAANSGGRIDDEIDSDDATTADDRGTQLHRQSSALTYQLRRTTSGSSVNSSTASGTHGGGGGISWSAATTPRCSRPSETILLHPISDDSTTFSTTTTLSCALRRFSVPLHIQTGESSDIPRFVMNAEAHAAMQTASTTFINAMRRLNPAAVARMTKQLPPILRCARPSPTLLWPLFERQLSTGSTPLLRAVLDLHDTLPELFEGRAPSLIEKILAQVNDKNNSTDHRLVGASWLLRQHAMQRHSGGTLLLADSWDQLLPMANDPPQLAAIKIKALGACLSAGVGDEEVVCRAVCSWDGFSGGNANKNRHRSSKNIATEQQLRAFTYALRILHSSADGPAAYRTHACLITGILAAIVSKPQLVPAVDAFLETCSEDFSTVFLKAVNAFFSGVDGQFESLKERPEDAPFRGTTIDLADRVKAAVISRSSSLSGMMRGLSFSLSFSKRTHSHLGGIGGGGGGAFNTSAGSVRRTMSMAPFTTSTNNTPGSGSVTPRSAAVPVVDVRALRSSISAAFQQQQESDQQQQQDVSSLPQFSSAMSDGGASSVGGAFAALVADDGHYLQQSQSPRSSLLSMTPRGGGGGGGASVAHSDGFNDTFEINSPSYQNLVAPTVPLELPTQEAAEVWLSSPATWESLSVGILQHDLLAYRLILKRALVTSASDVHPRGILRTIANYTWQYKEHHPLHALSSAKVTGNALLGLCHVAALAHLPIITCGGGDGGDSWTVRQSEVAESIQNVLDAIEEGFPVAAEVQSQCHVLAAAVAEHEATWSGSALNTTLRALLNSYVDAAVQG
jgi:hypothetical protein